MELVVDNQNSRILHRQKGLKPFSAAAVPLKRPHSIVYNPFDSLYYVADTDGHRIVAFDRFDTPRQLTSTSIIAGTNLSRPHDIALDPVTGWLYSLNPRLTTVFRFKGLGKQESRLDLSAHLSYARGLSVVNGRLYVIGSSQGKVVEIMDFDKGLYKIYQSPGKVEISPAGNWERTGLVLNDVEYFQQNWYATAYFCPAVSLPGQDYNKNKLIRFKTWKHFETGEWEDLSHQLPDKLVPYYLTVHEDNLYIPLFNHQAPGKGDCIYRLSKH
ncbi:MAG TPA: hypothetical protein EYH19_04995 [Desulfocapsa sulfexigens]|nr:hypothetical protein [Desulfocapsa sulfexigens]